MAPGDARLSLEREPPQHFDLLVLDAFSSDAIPVHLLTKEAFEVYQRHLNPNGVIAVHISNHYLDLEPVVVNLARHFGYKLASIDYEENDEEWWLYSSTWVLLSRSEQIINSPAIRGAASTVKTNATGAPLDGRFRQPVSNPALTHVNVYVFRLGFLGLGQRDGQDAIFVLRLHLVCGNRRRQRHRPLEASEEPLRPVDFGVFVFLLALALARNAQAALVERYINLLALHPGQFHLHIQVVLILAEVERRVPAAESQFPESQTFEFQKLLKILAENVFA